MYKCCTDIFRFSNFVKSDFSWSIHELHPVCFIGMAKGHIRPPDSGKANRKFDMDRQHKVRSQSARGAWVRVHVSRGAGALTQVGAVRAHVSRKRLASTTSRRANGSAMH